MGRSVFVPAPLAEVARVLYDPDVDTLPKRDDRRYVSHQGCWNNLCERPVKGVEGMWWRVDRDQLDVGDIYMPTRDDLRTANEEALSQVGVDDDLADLPERVWRYLPPPTERGTLTLVAVNGGTRITCDGCDLDDGDFDSGATDFATDLRGTFPELFEGRASDGSTVRVVGDAVEAFLRELLADGERWSDEVKRTASERGIKNKTLLKARQRVVYSRKLTTGKTIWGLKGQQPADSPSPQPYARTRAIPGAEGGHLGTRGHEGGAEPQSHMTPEGHEARKGHEEYTGKQSNPHDPSEPHDPQRSRGFLALARPHDPSFPHDPLYRGVSRTRARGGVVIQLRAEGNR